MSQQNIAIVVAAFSVILCLVVINCWLRAESKLNLLIKKYYSEPRILPPPQRSRWHRFVLSLFFFPAADSRYYPKQKGGR